MTLAGARLGSYVITGALGAGECRTPWLEIAIRDPAGVYGIERLNMTTDGKSYAYSYGHFLSDLYLVEGLR